MLAFFLHAGRGFGEHCCCGLVARSSRILIFNLIYPFKNVAERRTEIPAPPAAVANVQDAPHLLLERVGFPIRRLVVVHASARPRIHTMVNHSMYTRAVRAGL